MKTDFSSRMLQYGWRGLLAALVLVSPVAAAGTHSVPAGWQVKIGHHPVNEYGTYEVTVHVRDQSGRPVDNAGVTLRPNSFHQDGKRELKLQRAGDGRYRTVVRLNEPWEHPRRLHAVVVPAAR